MAARLERRNVFIVTIDLVLVLLCHKMREPLTPHAGQQGSRVIKSRASSRRCVVSDVGLCRSGRAGSATGRETLG
jgi:hypothetical protein